MNTKHELPPVAWRWRWNEQGSTWHLSSVGTWHNTAEIIAEPLVRESDAIAIIQRLEAENAKAREIIDQLCACHDEPECPAVAVSREWLEAQGKEQKTC